MELQTQEKTIETQIVDLTHRYRSFLNQNKEESTLDTALEKRIQEILKQDHFKILAEDSFQKPQQPSSQKFPQELLDLLEDYGLNETDQIIYQSCYGKGLLGIPQIGEIVHLSEELINQSIIRLKELGLIYFVDHQDLHYYIILPPYTVIEWLMGRFRKEINILKQTTTLSKPEKSKDNTDQKFVELMVEIIQNLINMEEFDLAIGEIDKSIFLIDDEDRKGLIMKLLRLREDIAFQKLKIQSLKPKKSSSKS